MPQAYFIQRATGYGNGPIDYKVVGVADSIPRALNLVDDLLVRDRWGVSNIQKAHPNMKAQNKFTFCGSLEQCAKIMTGAPGQFYFGGYLIEICSFD